VKKKPSGGDGGDGGDKPKKKKSSAKPKKSAIKKLFTKPKPVAEVVPEPVAEAKPEPEIVPEPVAVEPAPPPAPPAPPTSQSLPSSAGPGVGKPVGISGDVESIAAENLTGGNLFVESSDDKKSWEIRAYFTAKSQTACLDGFSAKFVRVRRSQGGSRVAPSAVLKFK
jgi:hypothetical protein